MRTRYTATALFAGFQATVPRAKAILPLEGNVTFFDGNFSEYEEGRRQTLGNPATRPHRITYRKLTR